MKLFEQLKVTKFFDTLSKLERHQAERYNKRCAKEVFVKRTIDKWLKDKKLVLYAESKNFGLEYKQYLSITNIEYTLGWSEELTVYIYDYSKPYEIFNSIRLSHNDILRLEGEWNVDETVFTNLLELFSLNIPEKEYIYQAYDFDKYPKRVKDEKTALEKIKITVSFFAKTEKEADKKKQKFQKENTSKLYIENLIDIKEVL